MGGFVKDDDFPVIDVNGAGNSHILDLSRGAAEQALQAICHGRAAHFLLWPELPDYRYVEGSAANVACMEHDVVPCDTLAPPLQVLLVDDQRAILAGVTALIESEAPSMRVAGCATSGRQALELACRAKPDVIVLDVDLGGEDGLELLPMFRACCDAKVIVLSALDDCRVRGRAAELGAVGFVSKAASGDELIAAILDAAL